MGKTKIIVSVILLLTVIIVIFGVMSSTGAFLIEGGNSITDANNCSEGEDDAGVKLTYNQSDKYCYNSSTDLTVAKLYEAGQYDLPLNTLYSSTGVILLVLMASLLVLLVVIALKFGKQK